MKKFFTEFKTFIAKGNVVDLAVAVIIGGAFNKIVTSLVNDVIMPLISLMVGGANVTEWKWVIQKAQYDANGNVLVAETALKYGVFIQTIIDFLIIALTVFIIVKVFKSSKAKIEKVGQAIISETKELTQKQVKAFKKLQKKLSKKGIAITETTNTANLDNTKQDNLAQETAQSASEKKEESPKIDDNKGTSETKKEPDYQIEKIKQDENNQDTSIQNVALENNEVISLLKEIRDSIKNEKSK